MSLYASIYTLIPVLLLDDHYPPQHQNPHMVAPKQVREVTSQRRAVSNRSHLSETILLIESALPVAVNTVQPSRSIARLIMKDKSLSSFDQKDAPMQPVNPFNLPAPANNAAGEYHVLVPRHKQDNSSSLN